MYGVVARALGVKVFEAPLCPDFSVDIPAVKRIGSAGAKLLFLCSPNNPTGNQSSLATISAITEAFEGLIVIDEAYIDFASGPSAMSLLGECDRLVVLRTLSKAWGLAGIRVGFAVGAPELIEALARIKMPYNVNAVSQEIACQALSNPSVYGEQVSLIVSERERVAAALRGSRGVEQVFESEGNFLLVRFVNSGCVFQALRDRGIVVRDRGREVGCERCIRISVGTPEENDVLLCVLREVV
jgi:histidinol-phosphate aminotransferase